MTWSLIRPLLPLLLCAMFAPAVQAMPALVDSDWLAAHRDDPQLVLLDIQQAAYYRQVHLPGAVSAPFEQWREKGAGGLPGMLPPIPQLEARLGQLGIAPEHAVVIVATGLGAGDMAAAARVFWTLKLLGHQQLAILNGGLADFADDPRRAALLTAMPVRRTAVTYRGSPDLSLLADARSTQDAVRNGQQLIDARSTAEFLGIHVAGDKERYGTLPRAKSLPFDWLTENGSGRVQATDRLRRLLDGLGVDPQAPQIHFCHSGNRAALSWFVAYALLGNREARLYDGSMLEWAVRTDLPMERRVEF